MEGITCISKPSDVLPDQRDYQDGQKLMVGDINAAVEGAIKAGADEVLVNDSHDGSWSNFRQEDLHESANLLHGEKKDRGQMEGLTPDHDVVLFVGYHAMAGTADAVLNHTYRTSSIYNLRANGDRVGEMGFNAKLAATLGVPIGMATGDHLTVQEAENQIEDIETVTVKQAIDRFNADCQPPSKTRPNIRATAQKAVERAKNDGFDQPETKEPASIEIDWKVTNEAKHAARIRNVERIGPRTTRIEDESFRKAYEDTLTKIRAAIQGSSDTLF